MRSCWIWEYYNISEPEFKEAWSLQTVATTHMHMHLWLNYDWGSGNVKNNNILPSPKHWFFSPLSGFLRVGLRKLQRQHNRPIYFFQLHLAQYSWKVNEINVFDATFAAWPCNLFSNSTTSFPMIHFFLAWDTPTITNSPTLPWSLKRHVAWNIRSLLSKRLNFGNCIL